MHQTQRVAPGPAWAWWARPATAGCRPSCRARTRPVWRIVSRECFRYTITNAQHAILAHTSTQHESTTHLFAGQLDLLGDDAARARVGRATLHAAAQCDTRVFHQPH